MDLKRPELFNEQVRILKEIHKMEISDPSESIKFLTYSNYYRFTGYAISFREDATGKTYCPGTRFDKVKSIYQFDEELRSFLHIYLEKVEIFARTQISYWFSISRNQHPPYDAHYDEKQFYNRKQIQDIHERLKKEESRNSDILFVQHHKHKYGDKMPLWVMVDLLSFSNLAMLYNCMYSTEKTLIASGMDTVENVLKNHLLCLSKLRNKCAHYSRLYGADVSYNPPAILPSPFLKSNPSVKNNTLFAYLLILVKRQPTTEDKNSLSAGLIDLIKKYLCYISFDQIGFPSDYEIILNTFR
nr:Abi family protein [uncultured Caproiciproducens sp.]